MLYELKRQEGPPTLLFLHGFLGTAFDWKDVVKELPFTCYGIDLPGHGKAPFTPDFCPMLLETAGHLAPLNLIGYSMGGRLALQFAARYPEKVASLILLGAHPGLKTGHAERLAKDKALAEQIMSLSIDEFLQIWYDQPIFKTLVTKMNIRSMRKDQNQQLLSLAMEAFSLGHQPDLSHIPALRLVGEFDPTYREHYRHLPHTVIPNAGHAAHLENPNAVAEVIYAHYD